MPSLTCSEKQEKLKKIFLLCPTPEAKYQKIIEFGRKLPVMDPSLKIPENLVRGCQSAMYLRSRQEKGLMLFEADSEALISRGLAALLVFCYSGLPPADVASANPDFLHEIGIPAILSPGRSNGLFSLLSRMRLESMKFLVK